MLQLKEANTTAIINKKGTRYSFNVLNQEVNLISSLLIKLTPRAVAISHSNDFYNTAAVIACLNTHTSFVVFPDTDNQEMCLTKLGIAKEVTLIFSDNLLNDYVMSINTHDKTFNFTNEAKSFVGNEMAEAIEKAVSKILSKNYFKRNETILNSITEAQHICFHKGFTPVGFRYSGHLFAGIKKGIIKSISTIKYKHNQTVLFLERFDLLHDIINGVITPLTKGHTVKFCSVDGLIFNKIIHKNVALYTSAAVLESRLEILKPKGFSRLLLRRSFNRSLGATVDNLIISGKINNPKGINLLRANKIQSLYTMCEIASFVAINTVKKATSKMSIGKLIGRDSVEIVSSSKSHGDLVVYTNDMAVHTNYAKIAFKHKYLGRINTEDACMLNKKNEIVILGKSILTFESEHGNLVDTRKYIEYAKSFGFVKNVLLISNESGTLAMLIEPDFDWASSKKRSFEDIVEECEMLNIKLEKKFNNSLPLRAVILEDVDGISEQLFKIATRRG